MLVGNWILVGLMLEKLTASSSSHIGRKEDRLAAEKYAYIESLSKVSSTRFLEVLD